MELALWVILMALATSQIVYTWMNGSIFATARESLKLKTAWYADLLMCNFCLMHWVAAVVTFAGYYTPIAIENGWLTVMSGSVFSKLLMAPVVWLAVTRLGWAMYPEEEATEEETEIFDNWSK